MSKSEDVIRMVEIIEDFDIYDPDAEIHVYYAFPDGEQLEIHEDKKQGKFTYTEFDPKHEAIDTREFSRYGEAYQILKKRQNKIMGWKDSPGTISLNYNPFKDIVFRKEPNEKPWIIERFNDSII